LDWHVIKKYRNSNAKMIKLFEFYAVIASVIFGLISSIVLIFFIVTIFAKDIYPNDDEENEGGIKL